MTADLHTHTLYSDGLNTPTELVCHAKEVGLTQIAVTDHDETGGISEATLEGEKIGVRVIPGVELSAMVGDLEVHLLGYFMHYQNGVLGTTLAKLREARRERVKKMVGELGKSGVEISADTIFELAGKGSVGRPHVARALIDAGIAIDLRDAFERFLVPGRPGYITHNYLSASEALELIKKTGGISVLAHPATGGAEQTIPELVDLGLRGLEVYYENYNPDQVRRLERTAEKYHLVKTGGSDYHGEGGRSRPVKLGSVKLSDTVVKDLEDAAQSR